MSVQRNDWSLHRKGQIDQARHKEKVKEAIKKNLGSIITEESIITSDGKQIVKVPIRSLDATSSASTIERKNTSAGDGDSKVGDVIARAGQGQGRGKAGRWRPAGPRLLRSRGDHRRDRRAYLRGPSPAEPRRQSQASGVDYDEVTEIRRSGVLSNLDKRRSMHREHQT